MAVVRLSLLLLVMTHGAWSAPRDLGFKSEQQLLLLDAKATRDGNIFSGISNLFDGYAKKIQQSTGNFLYCKACELGVSILQKAIRENTSQSTIVSDVSGICSTFNIESGPVCKGMATEYAPMAMAVLGKMSVTSSQVCGMLMGDTCGVPYNPWTSWNVTLPLIPQPKPAVPSLPKKGAPTFRVLHLTDVHFDSRYRPGSNAKCSEPLCCRNESGPVKDSADAAWKFGDYRSCDTPLETLENMFSHLSSQTFDYIIWTGDLPAHDIWEQPRNKQLASLHQIVGMIKKYFPGKPVYPSLGNHEASPVNSFPPNFIKGNNSIDWLYNSLADSWKQWLPESALETVKMGAYYSVSPYKGLRIISLNMNYCNNQNWWMLLNATDPNQELAWLVNTLQEAENAGEKVHILGHIPPGITDCLQAWSWNYYTIVSRYQNTIIAQFFGHTHYDSFSVFYDVETLTRPVSIAYVAPSVTPFSGLNVGYRFYSVDGNYPGSSFQVLDHHTYILDLERANREGNITWELEYSAKTAYNMSSLLPAEWSRVIDVMAANSTVLQMYNKFYHKSVDEGKCDTDCRHARLCEARSGRSYDPSLCKDIGIRHERHYHHVMGKTKKHC